MFGLSQSTGKNELEDIFSKYGKIEKTDLIMDKQTGVSRGFAFIYYETVAECTAAKEECNGMVCIYII